MSKLFDIGNDLAIWIPLFSKSSTSLFQYLNRIVKAKSNMLAMYPIKSQNDKGQVKINDIPILSDKHVQSISLVRLDFLQETLPVRAYRKAAVFVHFMITDMCDMVIKFSSDPKKYHTDFVKTIKKGRFWPDASVAVQRDVIDMCTSLKTMPFVLLVNIKKPPIQQPKPSLPTPVVPGTFNAEEAKKFLEDRYYQVMADYIDGKPGIVMLK